MIRLSAIGMVSKIAPRDMRCSACPTTIRKGSVYVKTCGGRYCEPCGDNIKPLNLVSPVALQPVSESTS